MTNLTLPGQKAPRTRSSQRTQRKKARREDRGKKKKRN
jgi:hypothetical protein|tara:strand:+ start:272 stop:385 length:114 start_codon:yes stop_codon:yes gene_type:complete